MLGCFIVDIPATKLIGYMRHCVKTVQLRSFFLVRIFPHLDWIRWTEYLSVFSPSVGKYGPEKTLYLDTLHAVKKNRNPNLISLINCFQQALLNNFNVLEVQKMLCISFKLESFQPLTIFAKSFIVDVWLVSKYASDGSLFTQFLNIYSISFSLWSHRKNFVR